MPRHFLALLLAFLVLQPSCGSTRPRGTRGDFPSLATGEHRWSLAFASDGNAAARDVALLAGGDAIVVGSFEQSLSVSERTVHSAGETDGFIARLTPRGEVVWLKRLGGAGRDSVLAVATGPGDVSAIVGLTSTAPTLDGAPWPAPAPAEAEGAVGFVASLGPAGTLRWVEYLRSESHAAFVDLCFTSDGSVNAVGHFGGTVSIGDHRASSAGSHDALVARLATDGRVGWARRAGGPGADQAHAVACRADRIVVVGGFSRGALFGSRVLEGQGRGQDAFVATLDLDGSVIDASGYGGEGNDTAFAVTSADSGGYCLAGSFAGTASFGGDELTAHGQSDAFLACYDPQGEHLWSRGMGGAGADRARALGLRGNALAVVGTFTGSADFSGRKLASAGGHDLFVAKLTASGEPLWTRRFGSSGQDDAGGVAVGPNGDLDIAGTFSRQISFGGRELTARGMLDGFAARLKD